MLLSRFLSNERGAVVPLLALLLFVVLGCSGLAIDGSRGALVRNKMQDALDTAVIAATRRVVEGAADAEIDAVGQSYFSNALQNSGVLDSAVPTASFTRTGNIINGNASVEVKTAIMKVLGFGSMTVAVQSGATASGKGMELLLVLDVSGSMNSGGKIGAARSAALKLLDAIYGTDETRTDTWIGIAPFSGRVNVVDYGAAWMTGPGPGWAGKICTKDRGSLSDTDDLPPSSGPFTHYSYTGYDVDTCPTPRALGLTAEKSVIAARVQSLTAQAGTSTQVGMVWGWRMLSPKWQGLWGNADLPLANADSPGKYVIIMTDGENFPWESGDSFSETEANQRLLSECAAMKAEGITIFTVAFDMGSTLTNLYQQCASRLDYHFDVPTNSDLVDTFEKLGLTIAGNTVYLTN